MWTQAGCFNQRYRSAALLFLLPAFSAFGQTTVRAPLHGIRPIKVTEFGADPAGVQDSVPGIQAAINYVGRMGGGTVLFPPGTYKLASYSTSNPATWNLAIGYDNVTLQGMGGPERVLIYQAASGSTVISSQSTHAINIGITPDIFVNTYQDPSLNGGFYTAQPVAAEDNTITFVSAGSSSTFVRGDIVVLYGNAGVLSSANRDLIYPEEVNQVVSVSPGVLTLKWPLTRSMADATTRKTYVAKVTSLTRKNIRLSALTVRAGLGVAALQVLGLTLENCVFQADTTLNSAIAAITIGTNTIRGWRMSNNRFEPYGTGTNLWTFELPSKASMDGVFENNTVIATVLSFHEFAAHTMIRNNRFDLGTINGAKGDGTTGTPKYGAIIGGRDIHIEANVFHTSALPNGGGSGLWTAAIGGFDAGHVTIQNNQFDCRVGNCLANSLDDTRITGNIIRHRLGYGITTEAANANSVISGNRVYTATNGYAAIAYCGSVSEHMTITANILMGAGSSGAVGILSNCPDRPHGSSLIRGNTILGFQKSYYITPAHSALIHP